MAERRGGMGRLVDDVCRGWLFTPRRTSLVRAKRSGRIVYVCKFELEVDSVVLSHGNGQPGMNHLRSLPYLLILIE